MNETGKKVLDVTIGWIGGVCGVLLVDLLTLWYVLENYNITPKG